MSDSVVHYFYAWIKYFSSVVSFDALITAILIIYAAITFLLLIYKFASYDCDVYYGARNALTYLNATGKTRSGSLNYYMRSFPTNIQRAWERYNAEKSGKPSDYLTSDLAYSYKSLENGFLASFKVLITLLSIVAFLFAITVDRISLTEALFLPAITLFVGIALNFIINMCFTVTKRLAFKKYSEMVKALNFYAANNFNEKAAIVKEAINAVAENNAFGAFTPVSTYEKCDEPLTPSAPIEAIPTDLAEDLSKILEDSVPAANYPDANS